jgi:hypothetical protein
MLGFLLDEQISYVVMEQVRQKRPEIRIESVLVWNGGDLCGKDDDMVLSAAHADSLTLVTYDQKTITPLVMQWATEGRDHTGVVFIDDRSILQEDVGGQVRALIDLWEKAHTQDWTNAVGYLKLTNR